MRRSSTSLVQISSSGENPSLGLTKPPTPVVEAVENYSRSVPLALADVTVPYRSIANFSVAISLLLGYFLYCC